MYIKPLCPLSLSLFLFRRSRYSYLHLVPTLTNTITCNRLVEDPSMYKRRILVLAGYQTFSVCRAFDGTLPNALPFLTIHLVLLPCFPGHLGFEKLFFYRLPQWLSQPFNSIDSLSHTNF